MIALAASTVRDGPRFLISCEPVTCLCFVWCHMLAICPAGRVRNGRDGWHRRYRTCETNARLYPASVLGDPRLSVGCSSEWADRGRVVLRADDLYGECIVDDGMTQ